MRVAEPSTFSFDPDKVGPMNWLKLPVFSVGLLALLGGAGCSSTEDTYHSDVPVTPVSDLDIFVDTPESVTEESSSSEATEVATEEDMDSTLELPPSVNLDVPFFSQAPTGDWGMPYQEACEEASLLLAIYFVTGETPTAATFEADELAMVDWEIERFGQYEHTTVEQTAEIATDFLQHTAWEIVEDPSVEDLKTFLAQGYPLVAPMAGRALGNPYFTGEGPVYHMLVVRGYDDAQGVFITNDVGTRHGKNFVYDYDVFMNALHDWHDAAETDPEGIFLGEARVLVVKP